MLGEKGKEMFKKYLHNLKIPECGKVLKAVFKYSLTKAKLPNGLLKPIFQRKLMKLGSL